MSFKLSIFYRLLWSYSAIFLLLFTTIFIVLFINLSRYQIQHTIEQLHQATLSERKRLELELSYTLRNVKAWSTLGIMDDLLTDDADQRIARELEKLKTQYDLKGHVYALSNKGSLVAADYAVNKSLDLSVWFAHTKTNTPFIDKHINPVDDKLIIAFWQPVTASFDNQQIIGYLVITYPWQNVTAFLPDTNIAKHLMLFSQDGQTLHQDEHLPLMNNISVIKNSQQNLWYSCLVSEYIEAKNFETKVEQQTYLVEILSEDANLPLTNTWQWVAFAVKQQVLAPIKNLVIEILIWGAIIVVCAFFVIYILSQHLTKPIQILTRIAAEIADTLDLSKRMPDYGHDEIGKFAASFNNMCDHLEKTWQEKNHINEALQILNEQLEQKVAERTVHLEWQARHDILTNLPNRALLEDHLDRAIARCNRGSTLLAVLFIDLDGFKAINDNFGHAAGDFLLVELSKRFLESIREPDTVARLGGDEFVVLLELETPDGVHVPLGRIRDLINTPIILDDKLLKVSPSIGVTIYPLDPSDSDTLIRHADHAMYHAKQEGRNQVQFFSG